MRKRGRDGDRIPNTDLYDFRFELSSKWRNSTRQSGSSPWTAFQFKILNKGQDKALLYTQGNLCVDLQLDLTCTTFSLLTQLYIMFMNTESQQLTLAESPVIYNSGYKPHTHTKQKVDHLNIWTSSSSQPCSTAGKPSCIHNVFQWGTRPSLWTASKNFTNRLHFI